MTLKEKHALKVKLGKCYSSDKRRIMEIAKREIDSMPTTEERPQGEWIITNRKNVFGGFEFQCPCCLTKLMVSCGRYEVGENYCDVCGAKMKKPWVGDEE